MKASFRLPLLAALCVLLNACAGVPLTTMWKLRNFDNQQFAALDPAQLRVGVQTEQRLRFEPGTTMIYVGLSFKDGSKEAHTLPLREIASDVQAPAGLPVADADFHWFISALDAKGIAELKLLQARVNANHASPVAKFHIDVELGNPSIEGARTSFDAEIWLQLSAADGYLQALRRTTIEPNKNYGS
jgi:hypothetical protein